MLPILSEDFQKGFLMFMDLVFQGELLTLELSEGLIDLLVIGLQGLAPLLKQNSGSLACYVVRKELNFFLWFFLRFFLICLFALLLLS